jgi:soluble lytic murein transglycosylase-like protein
VNIALSIAAATTLGVVALAAPTKAWAADCFTNSAERHGLDAALLRAVAAAESGMRADAVNAAHRQRTSTVDIGLMQVNSAWLPRLAAYGIGERELHQPCTNIDVGAWILAQSFARHGNHWTAVGAYNAGCTRLKGEDCTRQRASYAWRVYRRLVAGFTTTQTVTPSAPRQDVAAPALPGLHLASLQRVEP